MNDHQLNRKLQRTGMECFVTYFCEFADASMSNADVVEMLMQDRDYTEKSSEARTSHSRRIIRAGRARDALIIISRSSRMTPEIADEAQRLAEGL